MKQTLKICVSFIVDRWKEDAVGCTYSFTRFKGCVFFCIAVVAVVVVVASAVVVACNVAVSVARYVQQPQLIFDAAVIVIIYWIGIHRMH